MNPLATNTLQSESRLLNERGGAEQTLRMIAALPAPEGLADRVNHGLRHASREGRVLSWPVAWRGGSPWMRSAAAAAIVMVVAGGGWRVYSTTQHSRVIVMPPHVGVAGGFSGSKAMRTPQTLPGPVVTMPVTDKAAAAPQPVKAPGRDSLQRSSEANPVARPPQIPASTMQ